MIHKNYKKILIIICLLITIASILSFIFLSIKEKEDWNEEGDTTRKIVFMREDEKKDESEFEWQIEIRKIDVSAEISEGTDNNTLKNYVGHIEGTGISNSNICLAGHNNTGNYTSGNFYFDRLDELVKGDEIIYTYSNISKTFIVDEIKEVDETDLSVLEKSNSTKLTLITCIKGKYHKRLCVVCKEIEK